MNKISNRYLVIAFLIIAILSLYFGSGVNIDSGMNGKMNINESGWMGGNNWRWFPTIVTLLFGFLVGWLLFRKKI